ncbi:MAG: ECF transporter S component [Phycisphaerales bacterium]|nr:MAG: ECF transporter S component [Phycisphaerales bacterium]
MSGTRGHFFSLHELLIMAALGALGGVSGSAVSLVRAAVHALVALPGGMQFLGGIHVLWPVLAVGLVRKPGAATVTGLLQGAVELLSGNPHGLLVLAYGAMAGLGVDTVWILLGGRHRLATFLLAGGVGASTNVLVLKIAGSLPGQGVASTGLAILAGVAFISGMLLAGALGWSLMKALLLAGVIGAQLDQARTPWRRRIWLGVGALGVGAVLVTGAMRLKPLQPETSHASMKGASHVAAEDATPP